MSAIVSSADEPIDKGTARVLWTALVILLAWCAVSSQCGCTAHRPPTHIALPSTLPVKRAVAVATAHTANAAASNARAVAIARKAVLAGIAAGSQDATDLAADTQATADDLAQVKTQLGTANDSLVTITAELLTAQEKIDAQTSRLAALQTKYDAAVKTIWWYRVRFWGPLTFAVLALVIYLLTRFTSWGARTFGPYILGVEKVAAKAAVFV